MHVDTYLCIDKGVIDNKQYMIFDLGFRWSEFKNKFIVAWWCMIYFFFLTFFYLNFQ